MNHLPALSAPDFDQFFKELADLTVKDIHTLPFSRASCHFRDISCPSETRVKVEGETELTYLHANYVVLAGSRSIATQYPLQNALFWKACRQASLIVDLTNEGDLKKGLVPYAPSAENEHQVVQLGGAKVACTHALSIEGATATEYNYHVQDEEGDFKIRRLHYRGWNDRAGLDNQLDELDKLTDLIGDEQAKGQTVLIHCRAGVGRTGTALVSAVLKRLILQGHVNPSNLLTEMKQLILEGRRQRGKDFVQNADQLRTIWKLAVLTLQKNTIISAKE